MPEHLRNAAFEAAVLPEKYTTPDHYDMTTRVSKHFDERERVLCVAQQLASTSLLTCADS
jgi:hypothetical protein